MEIIPYTKQLSATLALKKRLFSDVRWRKWSRNSESRFLWNIQFKIFIKTRLKDNLVTVLN